jgi:outer membrane protein OmpA-like peptidoglycan-associated protein
LKDDGKGRYMVAFRIGDTYEIDVTKEGHTFYNTTYTTEKPETLEEAMGLAPGATGEGGAAAEVAAEPMVKIEMNELTTDTKMVFNDITFESNSAELNEASYEELGRIVRLMQENPTIRIEISAHTDDIGSDAINIILSEKRARTVINYLVARGIKPSSLKSKGHGKSRPIVPNDSDENRAKNRRVEMKIIE